MVGIQRLTRNIVYDRLRNAQVKVTPPSVDKLKVQLDLPVTETIYARISY